MKNTEKQQEIMRAILRGNPDGTLLDIDQLLLLLPYETTKESLQFSLRALIRHGMVEKREREFRRSRMRCVIAPTGLAYTVFGTKAAFRSDAGTADFSI